MVSSPTVTTPTPNNSPYFSSSSSSHPDGPYTSATYTRRADHTPNTAHPDTEETYILALHTDPAHHKAVTALRNKYFPPHLNKLAAHVALFRALPGSRLPDIERDIEEIARTRHPFAIETGPPFLLSRGVGLEVHVPTGDAQEVFRALRERWGGFLSQQDQSFKAHYTIQNKVEDRAVVKSTLREVQEGFAGSRGTVTGLTLYLYARGFWKTRRVYEFGGQGDGEGAGRPGVVAEGKGEGDGEWPALPEAGKKTR